MGKVWRIVAAAWVMTAGWATPAAAKLAELRVSEADASRPLAISAADVTVHMEPTTATVAYELTFVSGKSTAEEGTFYFALPRGAYVHDFGMWIDGAYQQASVVDAQAGRVAYEGIVRRGADPGLVEWTAGNTFKVRVFPLVQDQPTRVKLTIGLPLTVKRGSLLATVPLDLNKVERFSLHVKGAVRADELPKIEGLKKLELEKDDSSDGLISFAGSYKAKAYLPPDSIQISTPAPAVGEVAFRREDGDSERYFEVMSVPKLAVAPRPGAQAAVIYWDYSLSEEDARDRRKAVLKRYLSVRHPQKVDIYGFSQTVAPLAAGLKGDDWAAIDKALARRAYDGGTRIDLVADHWRAQLAQRKGVATDLLLFTNAVDSYELFDFKRLKDLASKDVQAFLVTPVRGANAGLLAALAQGLDATELSDEEAPPPHVFKDAPWRLKEVRHARTLKDVYAGAQREFYPGDALVVRGIISKVGKAEVAATFERAGTEVAVKLPFDSDVDQDDAKPLGLLPELWAEERVTKLSAEKRAHADEIKQLALKHHLLSPYTTMVVLQFCEDYADFKLAEPKTCHRRYNFDERDDDYADNDGDEAGDGAAGGDGDTASDGGDSFAAGASVEADGASADAAAPAPAMDMVAGGASGGASKEADSASSGYAANEAAEVLADLPERPRDPLEAPVDTPRREYGFEADLTASSAKGVDALYMAYLKKRQLYREIPYYYIYTADLFANLKRLDLADLVLSNIVEVRPGEARWLRIYAYSLVAWSKAQDALPLYRAIAELRGEDPQSFRDFGLAMEALGQPTSAMALYERVAAGKWDERLAEGMKRIIGFDLGRAARAVLKTPGANAATQAKAKVYAAHDQSAPDKMVITASWDTDNTDIDLHVVEPNGAHIFYANMAPKEASGHLAFDNTQGFGPEQYRSTAPYQGEYRVFLHYYSRNPVVLRDGTFARVDFRIIQNGVETLFTKTVFLKDEDETRTVLTFNYQDRNARMAPPSFRAAISSAKSQLNGRQYTQALAQLKALGAQAEPRDEAQRFFYMARAEAGLRHFPAAEELNQRAFALDPNLLVAEYNAACVSALAGERGKAINYLKALADALQRVPSQREHILELMSTDSDLAGLRGGADYRGIYQRLNVGH